MADRVRVIFAALARMCSSFVSRHSTPPAPTVSGNTFKKFWPNRQRLHPWSREGGGLFLRCTHPLSCFLGSPVTGSPRGVPVKGVPWARLLLPPDSPRGVSVGSRPGMSFGSPDQPKPRLAQRVCRVGLGRLVLLVSGNGLGTNAAGLKSHASPFHHAPFGSGGFLVRSLRRGVLV